MAFKVGDQVQLISGGPAMTVEGAPGKNAHLRHKDKTHYWCTWFKGATRDSDNFIEGTLKIYVPPVK